MRLYFEGRMANTNLVTVTRASTPLRSLYRVWLRLRLRLNRGSYKRLRIEQLNELSLVVLPSVFNPVILRTGAFLAESFDEIDIVKGARILDLGTGSGVCALAVAPHASHVIATDINPEAIRCAQINALMNHLEGKIEMRVGDLFEPVRDERFDLVIFNPPFYHGEPRDSNDFAWRSVDAFERFLQELPAHLSENGRALIVLSSDGEISGALDRARHLKIRLVRQRDLLNEILTVYELFPDQGTL